MFSITKTGFDGLYIIESPYLTDNRGAFKKLFSSKEFESLSLDTDFKETYYSVNAKNVIRGMHFQIPPCDHTKIIYVICGSVIDVCLDLRKNSPTYGKYHEIKLTGLDSKYLYIPKGFAHGFKSLEDNTIMHYMQTTCYSPENDKGIRYDSFGYDWQISEPIISARDLKHPAFSDFNSPFTGSSHE